MEHIVQFAINIDDNTIIEYVNKNAEIEIIRDLKQQVANRIFRKPYYNDDAAPTRDPLSDWAKSKIIDAFINENKDRIIAEAAKELAMRLSRTKAAKEILEERK